MSEIRDDVTDTCGVPVLIYAGDFDPSGEDIQRDFLSRTSCFPLFRRIAVTPEQVEKYDLPEAVGKVSDSRAARFLERHGKLVQVELEALEPDVVRELYQEAIDEYWDVSAFEATCAQEEEDIEELAGTA